MIANSVRKEVLSPHNLDLLVPLLCLAWIFHIFLTLISFSCSSNRAACYGSLQTFSMWTIQSMPCGEWSCCLLLSS